MFIFYSYVYIYILYFRSKERQQLPQLQHLKSTDCSEYRKKYSPIRLPQNLQDSMTSIHTPLTLQYKLIRCTNETSFMYKPPIIQYLFVSSQQFCIYILPEDGPFGL